MEFEDPTRSRKEALLNRDFILLGIKYESAVLAGLDETRLSIITEQIKEEAGDGWEREPAILQGRNAVREEQGLARLGEPPRGTTTEQNPARKSFLKRWLQS